jgi:hypothetical protein
VDNVVHFAAALQDMDPTAQAGQQGPDQFSYAQPL